MKDVKNGNVTENEGERRGIRRRNGRLTTRRRGHESKVCCHAGCDAA
jgi:hypothetical protein